MGCVKTILARETSRARMSGSKGKHFRRVLKKARLLTRPTPARQDAPFRGQGRSERRGEEVHTALRVGRSPLE